MNLVIFAGNDKGSFGQLSALINRMDCERIFLVKDKKTPNPFSNEKCKSVNIDVTKDLLTLKQEIQDKLRSMLTKEFEVALSIASGNGKEHMALISALLSIPVGIKLVAYTKRGVEFIN